MNNVSGMPFFGFTATIQSLRHCYWWLGAAINLLFTIVESIVELSRLAEVLEVMVVKASRRQMGYRGSRKTEIMGKASRVSSMCFMF